MSRKHHRKPKKNPCGCDAANPADALEIEPVQVTPGVPAEPSCVNWVKLEIVPSERDACLEPLRQLGKIEGAKQVFEALRGWYEKQDQEVGVVLLLDVQLNVRGKAEVSRGDRSGTVVPIPDILRVALVDGADGIVFCHNHPTGHSTPSDDDKTSTVALDEACEAVGLFLMDHVIFGRDEFFSFADEGLLVADPVMPEDVQPERDAAENPITRPKREHVLGWMRVAGHDNDRAKWTRLFIENRISRPVADEAWRAGQRWAQAEREGRIGPGAAENPEIFVEDRASGARRGWEHRRENDEFVVQNLDPSLIPLWQKLKGQFSGTPEERYDAFMQYAHDHPDEENEILQSNADAWLDAELRRQGWAAENPTGGVVQALLFRRPQFTPSSAKAWAARHGFKHGDVDVKPDFVHLRQRDPAGLERIRTVPLGRSGVEARIGWRARENPRYFVTRGNPPPSPPRRRYA